MSTYAFFTATVLQKNNDNFVCNPCGGYGKNIPIPAGDQAMAGENYWAVPVKTEYFQGFRYVAFKDVATPPTIDSIRCFKLTNLLNSDYYYVVGSVEQYTVYAAACCSASPIPSYITTLGPIAPCQDTCTSDGGTTYKAFFAVETLADVVGGRFVATVTVDNTNVLQQTFAVGSTSIANLVTYLNAQAGTVGTWSNIADTNTIVLSTTSKKSVCFIACIKTS